MLVSIDTEYLQEDDAWAVNETVLEWPEASNLFVGRMAKTIKPGAALSRISISQFMELVGALARIHPTRTYTMAIAFDKPNSDPTLSVSFIDVVNGQEPPLFADNAGFFKYAMNWFACRRPAITLSVTSSGLFWAHKE